MRKYILKRLLTVIPVMFIVSLMIFMLIHLTPGDPARVMLGEQATQEDVAALRESMGLDDPLPIQYFRWIGSLFKGDLGESIFIQDPMSQILAEHIGPTLQLTAYSMLFSILLAIPLGVIAAKKRGTMADHAISTLAMSGISIPSFLLGLFLILFIGVKLDWLPVAGYKAIEKYGFAKHFQYMILPSVALGLMGAGLLIRMTRSSVLDVLQSDYVKMARSKGVKEFFIIMKHALKNALLPILTSVVQTLMGLLSGAAVVETMFNIPGMGQLIVNSVTRRDYETIQIIVLMMAVVNVLACLMVDILYGFIDPRVKLGK